MLSTGTYPHTNQAELVCRVSQSGVDARQVRGPKAVLIQSKLEEREGAWEGGGGVGVGFVFVG